MRTITTTTGVMIPLDGDLLAIMETLYREVTARKELERSFEDMVREIKHLIQEPLKIGLSDLKQISCTPRKVSRQNEATAIPQMAHIQPGFP